MTEGFDTPQKTCVMRVFCVWLTTLLVLDDSKNPYQLVGLFLDPCYVYRVLSVPGCVQGEGVFLGTLKIPFGKIGEP